MGSVATTLVSLCTIMVPRWLCTRLVHFVVLAPSSFEFLKCLFGLQAFQ